MDESPPPGDFGEPKFVAIGSRVGNSGQVFETNGRPDLVVKLFTWAAGLPAQVVLDFTRDAMRVAGLRHPNVAQVVDAGMLGDGTPFVMMERLAGLTLDEAARGRSLPMTDVLPILRGVGAALSAAHAAGIAHGQLLAENVFIADDPTYGPAWPKLLDFGVARLVTGAHEIGRRADAFGQRAAERADQLALATLAWRLLGPTSALAIQRVLMRAMSPDPSQRFGSVTAFVEALEELSVSTGRGGLGTQAAATRTLAGAELSVWPSRLAAVAPAPAPALALVAPPQMTAPPPQLASPPSSLTQQFFAEGEQLDREHGAREASDAAASAEEDDAVQLEIAAAARVPRSRTQMIAAASLALASVAVIGWTVMSLASKPESGQPAAGPSPATVAVRPVVRAPAATPRPGRPTERGPRGKATHHRAPSVQPLPFAAPPPMRPQAPAPDAPAAPSVAAPPTPTATAAPEQTVDEARNPEPTATAPDTTAAAPPTSDDESPPPSAPEEPAPAAPAAP